MATNIKARIERLEQQQGGGEPLIVHLMRFGDAEDMSGVSVNGQIVACKPGQTATDLEEQIISDIHRQKRAGIFVVHQV